MKMILKGYEADHAEVEILTERRKTLEEKAAQREVKDRR